SGSLQSSTAYATTPYFLPRSQGRDWGVDEDPDDGRATGLGKCFVACVIFREVAFLARGRRTERRESAILAHGPNDILTQPSPLSAGISHDVGYIGKTAIIDGAADDLDVHMGVGLVGCALTGIAS